MACYIINFVQKIHFVVTSSDNHDNHCLLSMVILLLLLEATSIPNLKFFLSYEPKKK